MRFAEYTLPDYVLPEHPFTPAVTLYLASARHQVRPCVHTVKYQDHLIWAVYKYRSRRMNLCLILAELDLVHPKSKRSLQTSLTRWYVWSAYM